MIDAIVFAAAVAAGPTTAGTATSAVVSAARIPSRWQDFASCVVKRESGGRRNAQNPTSSAQGLYQFLDSQWRHGLPYMVAARLREAGMSKAAAKSLRIRLQSTPIKNWREEYQTAGFVAVLLAENGRGWRHWSLPGHRCQGLVPR